MDEYPLVGFGLVGLDDSGGEVVGFGGVGGDELLESVLA